jgi:hypothetical protein
MQATLDPIASGKTAVRTECALEKSAWRVDPAGVTNHGGWTMKKIVALIAAFTCLGWFVVQGNAAQPSGDEQYLGTWPGTWEGSAASGRFDLTLERGGDGKLAGGVSVGQPMGDYVAKFKSVSFEGNKMSARYDYTPDTQAEIVLTATFADGGASGTWSAVPQGQQTVLDSGTWKVAKKK